MSNMACTTTQELIWLRGLHIGSYYWLSMIGWHGDLWTLGSCMLCSMVYKIGDSYKVFLEAQKKPMKNYVSTRAVHHLCSPFNEHWVNTHNFYAHIHTHTQTHIHTYIHTLPHTHAQSTTYNTTEGSPLRNTPKKGQLHDQFHPMPAHTILKGRASH